MQRLRRDLICSCVGAIACATSTIGMATPADTISPYPTMAPIAQYDMPSRDAEIALARSAAPPSISGDAEILVLGAHGYDTAVKGKNGFVCLVQRSWTSGADDPQFWNPKLRAPVCLNPAAVRSVLPHVIERTNWVLAGVSKDEMVAKIKAQLAAKTFVLPEQGAMSFMMSKDQYLSDEGGHWHPHVMFYLANTDGAALGADLAGSPIYSGQYDPDPVRVFYIPVVKWSDGTAQTMTMK